MRRAAIVMLIAVAALAVAGDGAAFVLKEGEKTFIMDRMGEKWDVTQAVSLGFQPDKFQYGIGRNAFTPLDDSYLGEAEGLPLRDRVIGVTDGTEAHAYSVRKLTRHEIANTTLGSKPIAVGY
jgi:hypothetical protein